MSIIGDDDRQLQAERLMIDEVKKRPFLWDESLPEHKNMEKAKGAWDGVGRMFGMSGTKAKSRWKSMRDIYVRYLRKMALKGTRSTPKWKHFEAMSFLADHIKHRRSDLQYADCVGAAINSISNVQEKEATFNDLQSSDDDEDGVNQMISKHVTRSRKRKRLAKASLSTSLQQGRLMNSGLSNGGRGNVLNTVSATLVPVLSSAIASDGSRLASSHILNNQRHMMASFAPVSAIGGGAGFNGSRSMTGQETSFAAIPIDDDADDLFGRAIAATLKKMPGRMKALSKLRIQQVLYELEEAASDTPPPSAIVYQTTMPGPDNQQQQTSGFI